MSKIKDMANRAPKGRMIKAVKNLEHLRKKKTAERMEFAPDISTNE